MNKKYISILNKELDENLLTSEDIDKGCPFPIGTNVIALVLSNDKRFYFNLDA